MKIRTAQEFWAEIVSLLPSELQQSARDALKNNTLTPPLAMALHFKLEELLAATKVSPQDAGLVAKLGEVSAAVRRIEDAGREKLATEPTAKSGATPDKILEGVTSVRLDLRALQDAVDGLRPFQHWKVGVLCALALAVGGAAGWYGRIGYRQWQYEQHLREAN